MKAKFSVTFFVMTHRPSIVSLSICVSALTVATVLCPTAAEAILVYNIFEQDTDVVIQASGSIILPLVANGQQAGCEGLNGALVANVAAICTGESSLLSNFFAIQAGGPTLIEGSANLLGADSFAGIGTTFFGGFVAFAIDGDYESGTEVFSSATFENQTLAGLGFTSPPGTVLGTWFLEGSDAEIRVVLGSPTPSSVPGPLPLMGAAAAFGWTRKLRRRISASTFRF
jgi:hypothetical protein